MKPRFAIVIALVWLLALSTAGGLAALPALAQTNYQIELTQVDDSDYPRISLYLSITDAAGQPVGGLAQDEFTVLEDGQPVPILDFAGIGEDRPVDVVFVFDTTGSMRQEIEGVKDTCIDFAEELMSKGRDYRLGLVAFDDEVEGIYGSGGQLTDDAQQFKRWIEGLRADGGGGDPENDLGALKEASQMRFRDEAQQVFILITDAPPHHYGDSPDEGVRFDDPDLTADRITAILQEQSVTVYAVAYDHADFRHIVQETGGRFYDIDREPDFTGIIDEIGGLIASQYRLTYESARPSHDGTRRGIEVKIGEVSGAGTYVEKHLLNVRSELLVGALFLAPLLLALVAPGLVAPGLVAPSLGGRKRAAHATSLPVGPIPPPPPPAAPPAWSMPASPSPPTAPVAGFTPCPQCGNPLRPEARFCGRCGFSRGGPPSPPQMQALMCPHCGQALRPGVRFCGSCGNQV